MEGREAMEDLAHRSMERSGKDLGNQIAWLTDPWDSHTQPGRAASSCTNAMGTLYGADLFTWLAYSSGHVICLTILFSFFFFGKGGVVRKVFVKNGPPRLFILCLLDTRI